jgi:hypothetical protein
MDAPVLHNLKAKYPKLFEDIYFECGPGWYNLLDKLASDLQPFIDKLQAEIDPETEDRMPTSTTIVSTCFLNHSIYFIFPTVLTTSVSAHHITTDSSCDDCPHETCNCSIKILMIVHHSHI